MLRGGARLAQPCSHEALHRLQSVFASTKRHGSMNKHDKPCSVSGDVHRLLEAPDGSTGWNLLGQEGSETL